MLGVLYFSLRALRVHERPLRYQVLLRLLHLVRLHTNAKKMHERNHVTVSKENSMKRT